MSTLNSRQQRFCDEYIISLNATEAAKKAGYSERSAYSIGQRLLKKDVITKFIDDKLNEIQNEKIMTKTEVLEAYTRIARDKSINVKDTLKALDSLAKCLWVFKEGINEQREQTYSSWEEYIEANEEEEYNY